MAQLWAIQVAPRGARIYAIEQGPGTPPILRAWTIETSADATIAQARDLRAPVVLPDGANNLALHPDGGLLAVGDRAGAVTLIDTTGFRLLTRLDAPASETENPSPRPMAFSPDGKYLAVGSSQGGTISLWSVSRPEQATLFVHVPAHRGRIFNLVFDAKGKRMASAGSDALAEVWDLETIQRELARLKLVN